MEDKPTEFELITAIAFQHFKEENCQVVILEVGMGGRLDATNIIENPLLSIITGIGLDHTAFLGDTVEKIAAEKAGIIKENSVALYGGEDLSAEAVISEIAKKKKSILCKTDYSKLKITSLDLGESRFDYRERSNLRLSMLGSYQPRNAAIVLDALDNLSGIGLRVSEEAIREGLFKARWPARFEIIDREPLTIFDGAHNYQGITAATKSVKYYFKEKRVVVLTGVLRDKDYISIAKSLSEIALCAYTITPDNPRALSAEEYAKVLQDSGVEAFPCSDVKEAIALAQNKAKEDNTAVLCLGSLYTYEKILPLVNEKRR
jgi:dihydrofolate synthase/folylpolyglutamate synthase